jgi:hypothetical protein
MARIWILVEYRLRSFVPWLASISLVVAVEDDVVQDPVHVVFIISKNSYNTKPTVILHFSTLSPFWLKPTVVSIGLEAVISLFFRRFYHVACARANSKREFRVEMFCFTFPIYYVGIKICMQTSF